MAGRARGRRKRASDTLTDADVEGIYELLLRSRDPSSATLREAGWSQQAVDDAIELLRGRELIDDDGSRLEVHPPDVALPAYATSLERRAREIRGRLEAAQRTYAAARVDDAAHTERVRVLRGFDEITEVAVALERRIRQSLDVTLAGGPRLELVVAGVHEAIANDGTHDPVERRVILSSSAIGSDDVDADFASRQQLGYDIRTTGSLPFNVLIADREQAIVDTTNVDPQGKGSLLVSDPVLVRLLCTWFDAVHRGATPLAAGADASGLDARDTRIFTLMAAGLTDASIARRLGVSTRTVERRTRRLMEHVDATTRFQAGVKAARAGLI